MIENENIEKLKTQLEHKLTKSIEAFEKDLGGLRVGRATSSMLDNILVESYGSMVPLEQVSGIGIPDPRTIVINVWDKNLVFNVETALRTSNLEVNPITDGTKIRIPVPPLTEERRKAVVKQASEYAEKSKIAIRHIRKESIDLLKSLEKDKVLSEDEHRFYLDIFEKDIKKFLSKIDSIFETKSSHIMRV